MKTSSIHRPPTMAVKKEPKEERKGPKKGTAALGKANRQVSITGFFQRKWAAISVRSDMEWSGRRPRRTDSHLLCKFIQRHASPISENFFHPARCLLLVCNQKEITWKQGAKEYLKSWYLLMTFFKHNLWPVRRIYSKKKKKLKQVSEFSLKPFSGEFSAPYLPCALIRLWLRGFLLVPLYSMDLCGYSFIPEFYWMCLQLPVIPSPLPVLFAAVFCKSLNLVGLKAETKISL